MRSVAPFGRPPTRPVSPTPTGRPRSQEESLTVTRVAHRLALAVALCALVVPAAAQASPGAVIRDCREDGDLDHKYSNADLRKAEDNLPADVDEYTDCREVIAGAVTSGTNKGGGQTGGGGGGGAGAIAAGAAGKEQAAQSRDNAALDGTKKQKHPRLNVGGRSVEPGDNGLFNVASDTNGLPLPLLLALIAAVLLAVGGGLVALRRRIPALQRIPLLSKIGLPRVPTPRARD